MGRRSRKPKGRVQFPLSNNRAQDSRTDELFSPAQPRESQHAQMSLATSVSYTESGFARAVLSSLGLVILFLAITLVSPHATLPP